MAKIKGAIVVDTERCKGCNLCVVACPLNVISLAKEVNVRGITMPGRCWKIPVTGAVRVQRSARTVVSQCIKLNVNKRNEYGRRSCINER